MTNSTEQRRARLRAHWISPLPVLGASILAGNGVQAAAMPTDDYFQALDRRITQTLGNVLDNDSGAAPLVAQPVSNKPIGHGDLTIGTDGTLQYRPSSCAPAGTTDTFTYTMSDALHSPANAVVHVTLTSTVVNDSYTTNANTVVSGNVRDNDLPIANTLPVANFLGGTMGTVAGDTSASPSNGQFNYTPHDGVSGNDQFTYSVVDPTLGGCRSNAVVAVTIFPVAVIDAYTTPYVTLLTGNVLDNDLGTSLQVINNTQPAHGSANVAADGSFAYAPATGFSGNDTFQYTLQDVAQNNSITTVNIVVANAAPVAVDDSATAVAQQSVGGNVLLNDYDPNGDAISVIGFTQPSHGNVSVTANIAADGSFVYSPGPGFSGADSFTYTIADTQGANAIATVNILVAPVATSDSFGRAYNTSLSGNVLTNDLGSGLHVVGNTPPAHGTVNVSADGSFFYMPAAGFSGLDTFQYTINDDSGDGVAVTGSVTVLVGAGPAAPIPTFSTRALALLASLLAWFGLRSRRRER